MAENQCPESAKLGRGNDDRQIGKQNLEQLVKTKIMKAGKSNSLILVGALQLKVQMVKASICGSKIKSENQNPKICGL